MKQHLVEVSYQLHKAYCLLPKCHQTLAKDSHIIPVTLTEVANLAKVYPIVLVKSQQTGQFNIVALFGFNLGENLPCQFGLWQASHSPMSIHSQPFYLGYHDKNPSLKVLCVDINSPYVSKQQQVNGQPFFNKLGEECISLAHAKQTLTRLEQGEILKQDFIEKVSALNLIQPLILDVTWDNGKQENISGLYTINPEQVDALTVDQLGQLTSPVQPSIDYRLIINALNFSLQHISGLIELRNKATSALIV